MKFLIVEDNELMRRLIRSVVSEIAETIDECSNGKEAVTAFERHRHDWVVMDIEMPEMDGLTATAKIIAIDPNARVIIVTQHDNKNLREDSIKAGAVAFIAKENLLDIRAVLSSVTPQDLNEK
ncbi:MAG TPA: response regulator transcription factor [Pyrinomonadaceae bacterium]|nr:response regulator transcription factor [Pyrinomonadaceae bacterium]